MAGELSSQARLRISVEGLKELVGEMDRAVQSGGKLDKVWDKLQNALAGAEGGAKGAAAGLKQAGDNARSSGSDWDKLEKKVKGVSDAYKEAAQAAAAAGKSAPDAGAFAASKGVSSDELNQYRQGVGAGLLKDEAKDAREAAQATADWAEAERRLLVVQSARQKADDGEASRQMEARATADLKARADAERQTQRVNDAAAKNWIENEKRKEAESKRAADAVAKNWIAAEEKRAAAGKKALADYEKGMASGATPDRSRPLATGSPRTGAQNALNAASMADWDKQFAAAEKSIGNVHSALPSLRYALYDVATTAGIASTAITGVGVAATVAFASMESSFTNVERTLDNVSSGQVQELRKELVGLTREIPQSFANISEIATLGNQLGIQAGDIAKFTEVTAKFSAVTGLTAEASAQAFGSLGQLLHVQADDYEALGSSIALVGRKSVATEAEIVAMTTRLAASATNAGFTAQQVIALSGAFASLRIAPERAQGVMEIYFNRLNTAINEGGPRLEAFAQIAGVTADQVQTLVQTDPVGFFEKLSKGLGSMNQQAQTGALEQLGLDGIRAGEVFGRISANVDVFDKALQDANQGWSEASELGAQYAKVLDDLASRWQIFLNALQEAGAAVGDALAPVIGAALAVLTDLLQKFSDFAATPFGAWAVGAVALIGGIAAALTGLVASLSLASASFLAIRFALTEFATMAGVANAGAMTLSGTMSALAGTTGFATGALRLFRGALMATGIGAVLLLLVSLITDFNGTMVGLIDAMEWLHDATGGLFLPLEKVAGALFGLMSVFGVSTERLQAFADAMSRLDFGQLFAQQAAEVGHALGEIGNFFITVGTEINNFMNSVVQTLSGGAVGIGQVVQGLLGPAFGPIMSFLQDVANNINKVLSRFSQGFSIGSGAIDMGNFFGGIRDQFDSAGSAADGFGNAVAGTLRKVKTGQQGANLIADSLRSIPPAANGAAKAVRTLADYANDLSSVMKRAFDIRFGGQQGFDQITSGWQKIRDAADDAREAVEEHRRTLAGMAADKQIKQYWLMVAENYGDELRAAKLRAELADLSADQAKEQKDLAKAQDKASMTLVGNSEAAIENRSEILGLVGNYQDYLKALAASGMSQKDLQAKSAQLRAEFLQQATSMGYNRGEVEKYAAAFDDMATIIGKVPRNITVTANVNPALQALAEFEAKARSMAGKTYSGGTISAPTTDNAAAAKATRLQALQGEAATLNARLVRGDASPAQWANWLARIKQISAIIASGGYKVGGYTGGAGVNDVAGVVHGKEYVMSAPAVRTLGVNGMNFMHNMLKSGRIPSMGGGGGAGGMVELSPFDRQLLMDIKNTVGITIGAQTIQATTNGYNANMAQRRSA